MMSSCAFKVKGFVLYPCCEKEKVLVYEDSTGHSSIKCPRCGKYAIFDFDHMKAVPTDAARGVVHAFKNRI